MQCDVLVIGSGIAGLSYALELALEAPNLKIVVLSKRDVLESNTRYAQGGIAVVQDFTRDSFENMYKIHLGQEMDYAIPRWLIM